MPLMIWAAIAIEVRTARRAKVAPYDDCCDLGASCSLPSRLQATEATIQHLTDDWIDVIVLLLLQFLNVFLGFFEELKVPPALCGGGACAGAGGGSGALRGEVTLTPARFYARRPAMPSPRSRLS